MFPSAFCQFSQNTYSKHTVSLITSRFLQLASFCNVIRQTSIIPTIIKEVYSLIVKRFIITENTNCHHHFVNRSSPITICIRFGLNKSGKYWKKYITEHTFYTLCISFAPTFHILIILISVTHYFSCIYKHESLKTCTKRIIRSIYFL